MFSLSSSSTIVVISIIVTIYLNLDYWFIYIVYTYLCIRAACLP